MKRIILVCIAMAALLSCNSQKRYEGAFRECIYSPTLTQFSVWADAADAVELRLYETPEAVAEVISMAKDARGVWRARIHRDIRGYEYTFRTRNGNEWNEESPGIFAKAVSLNGERAAVVDMRATDPEGWADDVSPQVEDVIVYEMHHRDFSISPSAGSSYPGKFLALTEEGTKSPDGLATGIDHLKELGVTYVQILPSFDYASVDEADTLNPQYNWGYDPKNYNAPEGSYSTNAQIPETRIREMKQMILALHKAGIRVIMDVVYNHTYDAMGCALGRVSPGYFYRMNPDGTFANGSACGNETASDHAMMRRFMIASTRYWVKEYHVDGFRFDLMGIHDIETMRAIRAAHPDDILIYGEGWSATAPAYPADELAMKANIWEMPGVGAFSDDIRDALVGSPFDPKGGFAEGEPGQEERLKFGLVGAIDHPDVGFGPSWAGQPGQHISYVTCHDNYCLRDRLAIARPEVNTDTLLRMDKLAQTAVLTSQGVPFLFAGEEVFRTKGGDENSYKSPDSVNAIDWTFKSTYNSLFQYYKALIAIRKAHPGFHLGTAKMVQTHVEFMDAPANTVIYRIKGLEGLDSASSLVVVFNGNPKEVSVNIPDAGYKVLAMDGEANPDGLSTFEGSSLGVAAYSATILAQQ